MNASAGGTVELLLNTVLLLLMVVAAIGVVRVRNLFAVVLLGGVYSFLMATLMVALDAVDVGHDGGSGRRGYIGSAAALGSGVDQNS